MALNREQGTTLIMVTHDEHLAARCERQFSIEAGVLTEPAGQPVDNLPPRTAQREAL